MQVGVPGLNVFQRVTRATPNPMDKSSIISIYPKGFVAIKHTIQPGVFKIEPGSFSKPSVLVVGSSSWWKELEDGQPFLEITNSSIQVADSVVKDWANGLLGCDMGESMPGIFFLMGEHTPESILKNNQAELVRAAAKQANWYKALVKMGDILWSRSNGNPISISDDMRLAAQELGFKDKQWIKDFTTLELNNCPACGTLRNNSFPVCANCKTIIDTDKFKQLGLQTAV